MELHPSAGHLAAAFTVALWGTTFIATKVLLTAFAPVEILLIRFVIGFFALLLVCPRLLRGTTPRQEGLFAAAGLCGICLYYLLENIALTHTLASNAGVIVSVAPFFTVLLSRLIHREERLSPFFLAGFMVAMAGIFLISFHGAQLQINPLGDGLALLAAIVWAVYSLLTRKIAAFGYPTLLTTRRIFFYGILFMIPAALLLGFSPPWEQCLRVEFGANLLFLGLGASACCFVTWNFAVKVLGAVRTSVYIYAVPVITVVTSAWILHEPMTVYTVSGTALTLAGLFLSEYKRPNTAPNRRKA